jgi:hypothetical protein
VGVCGVPRSVRGRFSQVKGAFGVAKAMPLRGTLDLRASTAPGGRCCGQAKSPPVINTRRPRRPPLVWVDAGTVIIVAGRGDTVGCQGWAVEVIAVVRVR